MSKQAIPGMQAGKSALRKTAGPVMLVALLVFVVNDPQQAATAVQTLWNQLGKFLSALQTFLERVSR